MTMEEILDEFLCPDPEQDPEPQDPPIIVVDKVIHFPTESEDDEEEKKKAA